MCVKTNATASRTVPPRPPNPQPAPPGKPARHLQSRRQQHPPWSFRVAADPAEITRRAIAALGGIERFVKPGANVIVKPNICNAYHGPEYASTTNPNVVAAIVALCLGAGAQRVRVNGLPLRWLAPGQLRDQRHRGRSGGSGGADGDGEPPEVSRDRDSAGQETAVQQHLR